jgi:GMP synthase (glutamine-hydrolysing)
MTPKQINQLRFLLLQVRRPDDPMRDQEVRCFATSLKCRSEQIEVLDLIHEVPTLERLRRVDMVLMGGSGDYSVAEGGPWLDAALDAMRELYDLGKPTFASCWGFQALARALGGEVITDPQRAEVGTFEIQLTAAGRHDPVIGPLGAAFLGQLGHQDIVTRLPADATLLATSERGVNQAFTFPDKPIYCTQFHPELDRRSLLERANHYPEYVHRVCGVSLAAFASLLQESPLANRLLVRFVEHVFSDPAEDA